MTLPKIFLLASENFDNFDTMSFETNSIPNTSSLSQQNQEQGLNDQYSTMSTTLPLTQQTAASSLETNTIFDADTTLPPLPLSVNDAGGTHLRVECVMPGIYLTKDFISWKEQQLRAHGFTHIIIIDKHIQELYYPNQQPDIFKLCSSNNEKSKRRDDSSSIDAFDYYCPPPVSANHLNFGKEFQVIDLNFGEKSYLTTVLPNCYRAVKFINKALQTGGTILVIDCNGGEQKCLTIIVAYLMYKHNINFSNAFARLKDFYKKADLDRFYISQLYEYEPILQVQRAQSRGHSCSRELHSAILKRKKTVDDDYGSSDNNSSSSTLSSLPFCYTNNTTTTHCTTELLNNCNPLNRFDTTQMERQDTNGTTNQQDNRNRNHTFTHFMSGKTTGGWYNWDDYAME